MMPKNVLGIVYSNSYDTCLKDFTQRRTMGSMLYGGRYRLIDFVLSNFVNSGVTKVGVITNSHFRSLMDHVGNGRPWDLARKVDGLYLLPPFNPTQAEHDSSNKLEVLGRISSFIKSCSEQYVLLSDTNFICNIDLSEVFDFHSEKDADITIVYKKGNLPALENMMSLTVDGNSKVENSLIADGCIIEGTVKNCVVFRGVNIARGAVVENSIIMQDSVISENVKLNCVIMDKDSVITPNKNLSGDKSYPFIVGKNIVI